MSKSKILIGALGLIYAFVILCLLHKYGYSEISRGDFLMRTDGGIAEECCSFERIPNFIGYATASLGAALPPICYLLFYRKKNRPEN